ncbi:hypothetical protein BD560DRAFT_150595 [Blakeslea trispora]|nr:hypothetical protein BD560DRAFT_150595 [Blakeslea trispora]
MKGRKGFVNNMIAISTIYLKRRLFHLFISQSFKKKQSIGPLYYNFLFRPNEVILFPIVTFLAFRRKPCLSCGIYIKSRECERKGGGYTPSLNCSISPIKAVSQILFLGFVVILSKIDKLFLYPSRLHLKISNYKIFLGLSVYYYNWYIRN